MRLTISLVVLLGCLSIICSSEKPDSEITGYGPYVLGTNIDDFNANGLDGPYLLEQVKEAKVVSYVAFEEFRLREDLRALDMVVTLVFIDDKLEAIHLQFPELVFKFKEIRDLAEYVKALDEAIHSQYDKALWKSSHLQWGWERYSKWRRWTGHLDLEDEYNTTLSMYWYEYELRISYETALARSVIEAYRERTSQESQGKL